jgi:hypothetical protein
MSPDRSAWHRARRPCVAAHRGTQPWFTPPRPRVGRMPTIPPPVPGPLPPPPMARTSSTSATTMATRVWPGGGPDPRRSWLHQHRRRAAPSRGVWSSATTIVTGAHLSLASSLVAPDGSMAVAWKSFSAVCGSPTCTTSNWVLHVSTRAAGAQSWIDSGPLLGPDSKQQLRATRRRRGRRSGRAHDFRKQYRATGSGMAATGRRHWLSPGLQRSASLLVSAIPPDRDLGRFRLPRQHNSGCGRRSHKQYLGQPASISGWDQNPNYFRLAMSAQGTAIVFDSLLNFNGSNTIWRAATRKGPGVAWNPPATTSTSFDGGGMPESVAINGCGQAAVVFHG